MDTKYTPTEIFGYEDISKGYVASEGRLLSPKELIEKASKEDDFNVEYANYIVYKNKIQIEKFIMERDIYIGNSLRFIKEDYWVEDEDEFEPKINAIKFNIKPTVFDILAVLIRDQQLDLVFYIYYRETAGLKNLIFELDDEHTPNLLDKKMVIIQA